MTYLVLIAGMFVAGVSGLLIGCLMSAERISDLTTALDKMTKSRQYWIDQAAFLAGYNKVKQEVDELERIWGK
jgi:hypothetical protein